MASTSACRTFAMAAMVMALLQAGGRAQQQQQQAHVERVAGTVVSDVDGTPLRHAALTLTALKVEEVAATTMSDDSGHFQFEAVPAGKYRLTGVAARFLPTTYLQHEFYSTAIVTGAGLETEALELRLVPSTTISGRVLDDDGEPVERAGVVLYREDATAAQRVTPYRNWTTNDLGEYEFAGLPRGRYYLSASGAPWYAVYPVNAPESVGMPYRPAIDAGLNVAYATVFWPDATESGGAAAIEVHGGEQIAAEMRLHAQHAMTLTLRLPPGENQTQRNVALSQPVFGVLESRGVSVGFPEGQVVMEGIAPGRYQMEEGSAGRGNTLEASEAVDLTTGSVVMDEPKTAAAAVVSVSVRAANGEKVPAGLRVNLHSVRTGRDFGGEPMEKGDATFTNVPTGEYSFQVFGDGRLMGLLNMVSNGRSIPERRLNVTGNAAVELTISPANVAVEGFVKRDGKAGAGAMVVLVPAGADMSEELFRRDQADLDGSFLFSNVVPGNYIVVAIDDGWPLRWTDMNAMGPYLVKGVPLSVSSAGPAEMHLGQAVKAQPR